MNQCGSARSQIAENKCGDEGLQLAGAMSRQLIVFDIDAKGVAAALLIAFPMIANAIPHKFEVLIEERFGLAESGGKDAAKRAGSRQKLSQCAGAGLGDSTSPSIAICSLVLRISRNILVPVR